MRRPNHRGGREGDRARLPSVAAGGVRAWAQWGASERVFYGTSARSAGGHRRDENYSETNSTSSRTAACSPEPRSHRRQVVVLGRPRVRRSSPILIRSASACGSDSTRFRVYRTLGNVPAAGSPNADDFAVIAFGTTSSRSTIRADHRWHSKPARRRDRRVPGSGVARQALREVELVMLRPGSSRREQLRPDHAGRRS